MIFKGQKLTPEKIIEDLLSDVEYYDPKSALRTQISRLRYIFKDNTFYDINYIGGYYIFRFNEVCSGNNCTIDFKKFENFLNKGNSLIDSEPRKAEVLLEQGLELYLGEFLPDINDDWIVPLRSRYDRLYLRGMYNYLRELKRQENYVKIVEITEKAIQYKPYEEMLSVYFMEALVNLNQHEYALSHYEFFTAKLYNDLKIIPSNHIKDIYNHIQERNTMVPEPVKFIDIPASTILKEENCSCAEGVSCNLQYFSFLYDNKEIKEEMNFVKSNYMVLITLKASIDVDDEEGIKGAIEILQEILSNNLRKDDVFFQCKSGPILLLLYDISYYDINKVSQRLERKFMQRIENKKISLDIKTQSV